MSDHLLDIETMAYVASIGGLLQDRSCKLPDGGILHVDRVQFVIEYEDDYEVIEPFLRRQGHNHDYPLAVAIEENA